MADFSSVYNRLNHAQRQAVDTIEGPVLVIAGPGTGKTQLLSARIANILSKTDTGPENILCLTFTEAAAANMRERLSGMIGQPAYAVTISTYHAFGSELMRRYGQYFGDQPGQTAIDDLGIDALLRSIIREQPFSSPLKYAEAYVRDVRSTLSDLKRALLSPDDVKAIVAANDSFVQFANEQVATHLNGIARIDKKSIAAFDALAQATATFDNTTNQQHSLAASWQSELQKALAAAETTGKTNTITVWKNRWLARNSKAHFVVGAAGNSAKLAAMAKIYEAYNQQLAEQNLFDYDDMIIRAIRGLETNTDLRYTLQEQYLYVLLDEFQDTNQAQLRLVELLTDSPVNEGRPNVLAVGDDDQAIYAFQGADYSHMLAFQKTYRDVTVIPLTENYRSSEAILRTAEGISGQIVERLQNYVPNVDKTLQASNPSLPSPTIERLEFQTDVGQYAWVASKIKQLVDDGMDADEIAVLAPQHRYLEPLVPYLHQHDLPVYYEKRENVLDEPLIVTLTAMSQLVVALADNNFTLADSLWPEILSSDFWQLTTSVIWQLSWQAYDERHNWTSTLLETPDTKLIALFFIRLSQLSTSETLETMFDYLVGVSELETGEPDTPLFRSPFYDHYFNETSPTHISTPFWQLLSNLTVLRAHLKNYQPEEGEPLKLRDLLGFIAAHRHADIKILNTSPYQEAASAIQLMTAYKSKGLEFRAVFVLACIDEVWGAKARSQSSNITLPANLQYIRYAGQTNDERLRLFYVALTRAKTQLYLTSYGNTFGGRATTHLSLLDEQPVDTDVVISPLLPADSQQVQFVDVAAPAVAALSANWQQRHGLPASLDLSNVLQHRLGQYQLSPTDLNSFIDLQYAGPHSFFVHKVLRFPSAPLPEGQYGNAIHETLEWLNNHFVQTGQFLTEAALLEYFERQLKAKRLNAAQTNQLLERGTLCLTAYLSQRQQVIGRNVVSEAKFRGEAVFCGDAHLTGKIDKLIIDKETKTITVVDYKTGRSYSRWTREPKLHRYKQQLYIYKTLIEHSRTYKGYTVTDAYLEFVEPNEDGVITELHLNFNDEEATRINRLAEAVWRHIKDLSFPNVDTYDGNDMAAIEQFEADLIDGTI